MEGDTHNLKTANKSGHRKTSLYSYFFIENVQEVPVRQDGLVAKCYYSKKTFVWEILKGGLKSKIEIQWSNIIGIRASIVEGRRAILEFEVIFLHLRLSS